MGLEEEKPIENICRKDEGPSASNKGNKNLFQQKITHSFKVNAAIFSIYENYFNILSQNKTLDDSVNVLLFLRDGETIENVNFNRFGATDVVVNYKDILLNIRFTKYLDGSDVYYYVNYSSKETVFEDPISINKKIFENAIKISNLKGVYFSMLQNGVTWKIEKLEKRTFGDIYLPEDNTKKLETYCEIYNSSENILRYLFLGIPGSGKTESTLVIMNELNKLGVTIIKVSIDEYFKEKIELAEILAPTLIILDDIDLSLGSRANNFNAEKLSTFLDVLDGTNKLSKNVGIIAATNSAELLDIAAQRPGRFHKILLFDELTKENIENIIKKSLKFEFDKPSSEEDVKIYTDSKIIDLFAIKKVTGAYIYNFIETLKLKNDTNSDILTVESVIKDVESELKMLDKIKHTQFLNDKLENSKKVTGFDTTIKR